MEVVVPSPSGSPTFEFNRARTSPYLSAPSSPKRFGEYYLSAPTSPSRISEIYNEFGYFSASSSIPFDWEQRPGTPKKSGKATSNNINRDEDGDSDNGFAFFVSGESEKSSRSAEELFDGGKIKPLDLEDDELSASARSPLLPQRQHNSRSPIAQGKKVISEAFSPRKKKESIEQTRGRDRTPASVLSSSNSGRRVTRSHSPYRISHYTWDELEQSHPQQQQLQSTKEDPSNSKASLSSTSSNSKSSRKWRLRDFLLFRSASEGRGTNKDPLRKYPLLYNKKSEEAKNQSFRSSENNPNTAAPGSRRKGPVSPHELHYAWKKAESEDLKKKTFLPYKQGILGRLAGFGSRTR